MRSTAAIREILQLSVFSDNSASISARWNGGSTEKIQREIARAGRKIEVLSNPLEDLLDTDAPLRLSILCQIVGVERLQRDRSGPSAGRATRSTHGSRPGWSAQLGDQAGHLDRRQRGLFALVSALASGPRQRLGHIVCGQHTETSRAQRYRT